MTYGENAEYHRATACSVTIDLHMSCIVRHTGNGIECEGRSRCPAECLRTLLVVCPNSQDSLG